MSFPLFRTVPVLKAGSLILYPGGASFPQLKVLFLCFGVVKKEKRAGREERKLGEVEGEAYTKYTKHILPNIQIAQITPINPH